MEVLYPRCAGLDVHKDNVVARIRCVSEPVHDEVRTFATTTSALLELNEWLSSHAITHVAMEATGVYWKPVWHLLEGDFELILANAQHIRNVPGRKTDVQDCERIAELLQVRTRASELCAARADSRTARSDACPGACSAGP